MKKLIPFLCFALPAICPSCITEENSPVSGQEGTRITVGDSLPDFSVQTADGHWVSKDSLLGCCSMVVFFHTGCGDCRKELPRIDSVYRHFTGKEDFRLICIAREENAESITRFWTEKNLAMPYSPQSDRSVYQLFAHTGIPRIYISSPDGIVRHLHDDKTMLSYAKLVEQTEEIRGK